MVYMTTRTNTECPDFGSHEGNATDAWVEAHGEPTLPEHWDAIMAAAEAEYQACEGH